MSPKFSFSLLPTLKASTGLHPKMPSMVFDIPTVMDTLRKNIQSVATTQQLYLDTLQVLAHTQARLMGDIIKGQAEFAKSFKDRESPEDKMGDQALLIKQTYERVHGHARELQDMLYQSSRETSAILSRRVGHSLAEIKDAIDRAKDNRAA
jgi:phasin family protein